MKHVTDRKGYITLEAAVFLPVFILAVVSLLYYINVFSIMENVYYSTFDETSRLASKAGTVKTAAGFTSVLKNRIEKENTAIDGLDIDKFRYLYWDGDMNNMIAVEAQCNVELDIPLGFGHMYPVNTRVKCRGFTGLKEIGKTMTFEEMECTGTWDPVWIFPDSGEKYHSSSCTYVSVNAQEKVLTSELKQKYEACSLCDSSSAAVGSIVYCFTENGTVYHLDSCSQIDRYTIEINKEEAIGKGYTPCSKCGGG